jgi:hypothetical protein
MELKNILCAIDDFFFKPQSVFSVAVLRIAFGILLLLNWYMTWVHLDIFWGPQSLVSLSTAMNYTVAPTLNIFALFPDIEGLAGWVALINLVGVIGFIIGFRTRTSALLALVSLLSLHARNTFILNSADVIMHNFLFFMMFSHCGDWLSVDAWLARRRGEIGNSAPMKAPWALRLLQIQFSMIYVATFLWKAKGGAWVDGTAVYYATRLDEFVKFQMPLLNNLLFIKFLTWSTLAVELALGTLVWVKELRYWVLLAGIGLHIGIDLTMNIPLFEWMMIVGMIVMVPSNDLQNIFSKSTEQSLSLNFLKRKKLFRPQLSTIFSKAKL